MCRNEWQRETQSSCRGNRVPKCKRIQREHTEDWQTIQQYTLWSEQTTYELLRPIVLFGDPAGKRAWEMIADPAERRLAVIRLHAEGWSVSSIAEYWAPRVRLSMPP